MCDKEKYENIPALNKIGREICCGCEACTNICPLYGDAMKMIPDEYGFLFPQIKESNCLKCGACERVCPIINHEDEKKEIPLKSYAGYAKDDKIVLTSSSGGMFELIARSFWNTYEDQGFVAGVIWDNDFCGTHHILSNSKNDLLLLKKSKYIQSKKGNIYKEILEHLKNGEAVLFCGCPCESAALRSYLGVDYEKLWICDLVCQGPTSSFIMKQFVESLEKKKKSKINDVNLRFVKGKEWIPQWIHITFENNKKFLKPFYDTDLGIALHIMQRESCYNCKFAGKNRKSDITLGDYHHADSEADYYNKNGVSIVLTNTRKGQTILEKLMENEIRLVEADYNKMVCYNPRIERSWKKIECYDKFRSNFILLGLHNAVFCEKTVKMKIKEYIPWGIRMRIKKIHENRQKE